MRLNFLLSLAKLYLFLSPLRDKLWGWCIWHWRKTKVYFELIFFLELFCLYYWYFNATYISCLQETWTFEWSHLWLVETTAARICSWAFIHFLWLLTGHSCDRKENRNFTSFSKMICNSLCLRAVQWLQVMHSWEKCGIKWVNSECSPDQRDVGV